MFPQLSPAKAKPFDLALSATRTIHLPAAQDGVCCVDYEQICEKVAAIFQGVTNRIAGRMIMSRSRRISTR